MYLLDTNVISETRKALSGKIDENVDRWITQHHIHDCYVSSITLMELRIGIERIRYRDNTQGEILQRWYDNQVHRTFAGRILDFDSITAKHCALLHVPDPKSRIDAMIAATAIQHQMSVVTRNIKDFQTIDVPIINPWNDSN